MRETVVSCSRQQGSGGRVIPAWLARMAALFLLGSALAWSQGGTAQINGTVQDASGLAVPGAEIKVTQTATGVVRSAVSGADGSFVLPDLPIGPYLVEVTKEGFSKHVQSGLVLQVDQNAALDVALRVGQVSEQVVVEAGAAMVETQNTAKIGRAHV